MNRNVVRGRWKQVRGFVKELWGELTRDDLRRFDGEMDRLAGRLLERYGTLERRKLSPF